MSEGGAGLEEISHRYPGLGHQVEEGMAAAIDGEIYQSAYLVPFGPRARPVLIPEVGGG